MMANDVKHLLTFELTGDFVRFSTKGKLMLGANGERITAT